MSSTRLISMLKFLQDSDFMNLETIKIDVKEFIDQMRYEK